MLKRDAEQRLHALWKQFPVILLSGARQVGKTTLAKGAGRKLGLQQSAWLDQEGPQTSANEDPSLFIESLNLPAFLDEAQKAPMIFSAIRQRVDEQRKPGRFLLSGSANFLLVKRVSESLAGRAARLFLRGLSLRELMGRVGKPPRLATCLKERSAKALLDHCHATHHDGRLPATGWSSQIVRGRFPDLVTGAKTNLFRTDWIENYTAAFIDKDLPDFGEVHSRVVFRKFWRVLSSSIAQLQDLSRLGGALGLSYHTTSRYMGLLAQGCHLFLLEPYHANIGKRLTKTPKFFAEDAGLALHLAGIRTLAQFEASNLRGAALENFAVAELKTTVELFFPGAQLWFWRTLAGAEVDLVIEEGRRLLPIEIKWASHPKRVDCLGMESFLTDFKSQAPYGLVACATETPYFVTPRIVAVPLGWLLL